MSRDDIVRYSCPLCAATFDVEHGETFEAFIEGRRHLQDDHHDAASIKASLAVETEI